MADETGDPRRAEELQRKITEIKQKALEEEGGRIDAETGARAETTLQNYRAKVAHAFQQRLQEAAENRRRDESAVHAREQQLTSVFDEERRKKTELRQEEETARRRQAEEERQKQEEIARLKAEEEEKIRREEERRREEEAERQRIEAEQKRREEEALRQEIDRQRREEERRRQEQERQERIQSQISEAQKFYQEGEYEHALVEVAKALVNDPSNSIALELDSRIREIMHAGKEPEPAVVEEAPKPQPKKIQRSRLRTDEAPPRRNPLTMVVVAAGIIVIALAAYMYFHSKAFTNEMRLAVVPWTTPAQSEDERLIGTALAEEAAQKLDKLSSITVLGYRSSLGLSQSRADAQHAVYELGYQYLLRGTVTRNDQHITVNVMLVDSAGRVAWTNVYDRPPSLLPGLVSDIATQLVEAMKISHPDSWKEQGPQVKPEAYDEYLRGRSHLLDGTKGSLDTALIHFRTALSKSPSFTVALSSSAEALMDQYEEGWNTADSVLSRARQYAEAAIESDTSSADGYAELARVLAQRSMLNEALSEFDNALHRKPVHVLALTEKGKVLFRLGQLAAGIETIQRALDIDPRNPATNTAMAMLYQASRTPARSMHYHEMAMLAMADSSSYVTGILSEAITSDPDMRLRDGHRIVTACFRRLQAVPGDYNAMYCLARLRQVMGNEEAESLLHTLQRMMQAEIQQSPKNADALMVMAKALTRLGRFPEGAEFAQKALAIDTGNVEIRYQVAQVYAMQMYSLKKKGTDQGKKDAALYELHRAVSRSFRFEQLVSADFFNMVDQPEFQGLFQATAGQHQ